MLALSDEDRARAEKARADAEAARRAAEEKLAAEAEARRRRDAERVRLTVRDSLLPLPTAFCMASKQYPAVCPCLVVLVQLSCSCSGDGCCAHAGGRARAGRADGPRGALPGAAGGRRDQGWLLLVTRVEC